MMPINILYIDLINDIACFFASFVKLNIFIIIGIQKNSMCVGNEGRSRSNN